MPFGIFRLMNRLSRLLCLIGVCAQATSQAAIAQEKIKSSMHIPLLVLRRTAETNEYIGYVERSVASIPAPIQDKLASAGIYMLLTPRYVDAEPERSGERTFRGGGGTENIAGQFFFDKKRVLLMERASSSLAAPTPVGDGLIPTNRHELGHAYDFALGNFSSSPEFVDAHQRDVRGLPNSQTVQYQYAITGTTLSSEANEPTDSGRRECFAMVFAELVAPSDSRETSLLSAFPSVVAVLQKMEPSLKTVPAGSDALTSRSGRGNSRSGAQFESKDWASSKNRSQITNTAQSQSQIQSSPQAAASPQRRNPDLNVAHQLASKSDFSGAVKKLNDILIKEPTLLDALLLRANCFIWLKEYRKSIADLDVYLKQKPDSAEALHLRGVAWAWLGRLDNQREDEARARAISPHH